MSNGNSKKKIVSSTDTYKKEEYRGYPILVNKEKEQFCKRSMLKVLADTFESATEQSKTFFMRYDVRFPKGNFEHQSNKLISSFQADFMKELQRKKMKPKYVITREQSREKHQHYHGVLLLNGQRVKDIERPLNIAERIWRQKLGIPALQAGEGRLIDPCTKSRSGEAVKNGVMLRRDDPEYDQKCKECFKRASYLAKENTKGYAPSGAREILSSRVKQPKQGGLKD